MRTLDELFVEMEAPEILAYDMLVHEKQAIARYMIDNLRRAEALRQSVEARLALRGDGGGNG